MSRIAGSCGHAIFVFWRTFTLFSIVTVPVYILRYSVGGLPFLHTLSSIHCRLFKDGCSYWRAVMFHGSFNLPFSNDP